MFNRVASQLKEWGNLEKGEGRSGRQNAAIALVNVRIERKTEESLEDRDKFNHRKRTGKTVVKNRKNVENAFDVYDSQCSERGNFRTILH